MRRLGITCVGKDCPGMNAVIRGVARRAFARDMEVMGLRRGFEGALQEDLALLSREDVTGILSLGGTFLRSSTFDPTDDRANLERLHQEELVKVGGGFITEFDFLDGCGQAEEGA